MGGHFGEALGAWYHASKFAVEGFSDSLRLELHGFGIQVVLIEPGPIRTEWGEGAYAQRREILGHHRLRRSGQGDEGAVRPGGGSGY